MLRKRFLESQSTLMDQHLFNTRPSRLFGATGPGAGGSTGMGRLPSMAGSSAFPSLPPLMPVASGVGAAAVAAKAGVPNSTMSSGIQRTMMYAVGLLLALSVVVLSFLLLDRHGYGLWDLQQRLLGRAPDALAPQGRTGAGSAAKDVSLLLDRQCMEHNKLLLGEKDVLTHRLQTWHTELINRNDKIAALQMEILELRDELQSAAAALVTEPYHDNDDAEDDDLLEQGAIVARNVASSVLQEHHQPFVLTESDHEQVELEDGESGQHVETVHVASANEDSDSM